jgi:hypothetical protein
MYYPMEYVPAPPREVAAIQTIPEGAVRLFPAAVWKASESRHEVIPREWLIEALMVAESLHTEDRIDSRNSVRVTIPTDIDVSAGSVTKTSKLEVSDIAADSECIWLSRVGLISDHNIIADDGMTVNFKVSKFPKSDDAEKNYLAVGETVFTANEEKTYDFGAAGQLGADLRLVPGDTITLVVIVAVAPMSETVITLNPYGRKARRLV